METSETKTNHEIINIVQTNQFPSHIPNNLTSSFDKVYLIHNSESAPRIISISKSLIQTPDDISHLVLPFNTAQNTDMTCLKALTINNTFYLFVGLYGSLKMWSIDGTRLITQITPKQRRQNKIYAFLAICQFQMGSKGADSVLLGDNYGQLFLLYSTGSSWTNEVLYNTQIEGVISISNYLGSDYIGVCYDSMKISIFKYGNKEVHVQLSFNEDSLALTSTSLKEGDDYYFAVGFYNGTIKIYNYNTCGCVYNIASHLRGINALISYDNYVISGSDDGCVNVWKINFSKKDVEIKYNMYFEDKMIVGLVYEKATECLYIVSYDHPELIYATDVKLK